MANLCSLDITVTFKDQQSRDKAFDELGKVIARCDEANIGWIPKESDSTVRALFDIDADKVGVDVITMLCTSKWSYDVNDLYGLEDWFAGIADVENVRCTYYEPGELLYGTMDTSGQHRWLPSRYWPAFNGDEGPDKERAILDCALAQYGSSEYIGD